MELSEEQQISFSVLYGLVFSLSLVVDYLDGAEPIITDRNNNYASNKLKEAYVACNKLSEVMTREFTKTLSPQNKVITLAAIEEQKNFIYSIMMLDASDQHRVKGLIGKILKDKL